MLRYLVTDFGPSIRIVTVTGQDERGRFADGVVAVVSKAQGQWHGLSYEALKPGWYNPDGTYRGAATTLTTP